MHEILAQLSDDSFSKIALTVGGWFLSRATKYLSRISRNTAELKEAVGELKTAVAVVATKTDEHAHRISTLETTVLTRAK